MEAVTLDRALEALADRGPGDLDRVSGLEDLHRDGLADGQLRRPVKLDQMPVGGDAALLQVAELALADLAIGDRLERELDGLVAVLLVRLHLDDRARPRLDHGHGRHAPALGIEDLGHAQLSADDSLHYNLISMSTPAGRSSRISESTVFGVGLWMSIRRLCVRTSKCSRESLSLNGLRITQ